MAFNITEVAKLVEKGRSVDVVFEFEDDTKETVHVTYAPERYNAELEELISRAQGNPAMNARLFVKFIATLVTKWDVVRTVGHAEGKPITEPYPLTEAELTKLHSSITARIATEISNDMQRRADEGKNSGAGSQPAVS